MNKDRTSLYNYTHPKCIDMEIVLVCVLNYCVLQRLKCANMLQLIRCVVITSGSKHLII